MMLSRASSRVASTVVRRSTTATTMAGRRTTRASSASSSSSSSASSRTVTQKRFDSSTTTPPPSTTTTTTPIIDDSPLARLAQQELAAERLTSGETGQRFMTASRKRALWTAWTTAGAGLGVWHFGYNVPQEHHQHFLALKDTVQEMQHLVADLKKGGSVASREQLAQLDSGLEALTKFIVNESRIPMLFGKASVPAEARKNISEVVDLEAVTLLLSVLDALPQTAAAVSAADTAEQASALRVSVLQLLLQIDSLAPKRSSTQGLEHDGAASLGKLMTGELAARRESAPIFLSAAQLLVSWAEDIRTQNKLDTPAAEQMRAVVAALQEADVSQPLSHLVASRVNEALEGSVNRDVITRAVTQRALDFAAPPPLLDLSGQTATSQGNLALVTAATAGMLAGAYGRVRWWFFARAHHVSGEPLQRFLQTKRVGRSVFLLMAVEAVARYLMAWDDQDDSFVQIPDFVGVDFKFENPAIMLIDALKDLNFDENDFAKMSVAVPAAQSIVFSLLSYVLVKRHKYIVLPVLAAAGSANQDRIAAEYRVLQEKGLITPGMHQQFSEFAQLSRKFGL